MNIGVTGTFTCTIPGEQPSHTYAFTKTIPQPLAQTTDQSADQSTSQSTNQSASHESVALTALVDLLTQAKDENNAFLTAIIAHEKQPNKRQKQ